MRSQPPPIPVSPHSPAPTRNTLPLLLRCAAVLALAATSVALGAFALPALRRPTPESSEPTSVEHSPDLVRSVSHGETQGIVREQPILDESPPASVQNGDLASRNPIEPPPVLPLLPSQTGPYALSLRIDAEVDAKSRAANLPLSPLASDGEFLRRVFLDLVGRVPSRERTLAFLADTDPHKRARLVDELLARPEYGQHFARLWAEALVKRDFDTNRGLDTERFEAWLAGAFQMNHGWDQIVRDMVTATGEEQKSPPTFFVLANMDNRQPSPSKLTGAVGNLFMGIQIQCAECHKHPFTEKWGVQDFWGMAAFFAHTRAQRPGGPRNKKMNGPASIAEVEQTAATRNKKGQVLAQAVRPGLFVNVPDPNDPRKTVGTARGKFFESQEPPGPGGGPYRPRLARWLTSPENRYFSRAAVNRLWAHFFARGIVHPIEDMSDPNRPTHPELLTQLASAFAASKFDQKFLIQAICNSQTYQRTSRPLPGNSGDDRLYSHMPVKVLDARQLIASLGVVTQREIRGGRQADPGKRGIRDAGDQLVRYLDTRDYDDDPTEFSYGIPQLLRLMNTSLTAASHDRARQLAGPHGSNPAAVLEDLYLTALTRRPSGAETQRMLAYVAKQGDPNRGYGGVLWALLNSAEFLSNH